MMKRVASLACGLILAACLVNAQALSKEAKIERLLALTNADATMNQVFDQMKAMMASQKVPGSTPEQQAKAQEMQGKILELVKTRMSFERIRPQYVKAYSETFSDEEIDGMLAFYESSAGRAMLEKMPLLMPKMMALVQAQMGDLLPEIQRITKEALQK